MEMTENILEEAQTYRVNRPPSDEDESRDTNYDFSKDIKEAQSFKIFGFYKLAVVFFGLLCVLLSAVIVGLYIKTEGTTQFQLRYNNLTEEKNQLQMQYNKLNEEKDQLQMQYNKLNEEKDQLQMQYNNLTEEKNQLQMQYNNQTEEKDQLQMQYNKLNEEKDQLQMQYNKLNEEKDQLQMQYNNLNEEKDQLQMQYNKLNEEKDQVEADRNRMIKDLETNNNNLRNEKSQLTDKFTTERDELQRRLFKLESHDMKTIKQHAVDVTLDPDTASPVLTLSADGKRATHGPLRKDVLQTSKRFLYMACVLGKEGFSSGKFYYEVVVETTSELWVVGVARESISRTESTLSPENGHWTQTQIRSTHERVGIFVDYDAGLVSFYDVDTWCPISSYNNATFNERIYPFFWVPKSASVTIPAVVKCTSE